MTKPTRYPHDPHHETLSRASDVLVARIQDPKTKPGHVAGLAHALCDVLEAMKALGEPSLVVMTLAALMGCEPWPGNL
jgi:hypothetical protein